MPVLPGRNIDRSCQIQHEKSTLGVFYAVSTTLQKEHSPSHHMMVKQKAEKKSQLTPLAEEYAKLLEEEQGRQKVKVEMDMEVVSMTQAAPTRPTPGKRYNSGGEEPGS